MSNLYGHREQQNNQRFDDLSHTLSLFRETVDRDINGRVQQEMLTLDLLNDNFSNLWLKVRRTSGDLQTVMTRNASLTRIVGIILVLFIVIWTLYHLR
ncbi:hypothetical protein PUMCH_003583 [Australozyma saopauloensis]|uniref:t-SNARE coiled-coil homology domain-containing protein n=1 Tax=Australozyma saopauloensis TaxID=291208 RepID=A0AAX4HCG3_9ASCO|nr:hypothetical protein PUMCH_003583 [[Candida] saopauloensis]